MKPYSELDKGGLKIITTIEGLNSESSGHLCITGNGITRFITLDQINNNEFEEKKIDDDSSDKSNKDKSKIIVLGFTKDAIPVNEDFQVCIMLAEQIVPICVEGSNTIDKKPEEVKIIISESNN